MALGNRSTLSMLPNTLQTCFRRLSRNRAIRLTTEGTRFLLLTLAVGVAAVNTGNNLFYLLLAMMLSLIVLSGLLSEQCVRRLEFHRHLPEYLFANEPATVTLWIANRKSRVPSVSLRLFDVVAGQDLDRGMHLSHLAPHSSTLISYPLLVRRRGQYRFDGVRVVTPFPFGLFQKKAFYPFEASLLVCPEIIPLPPLRLDELHAVGQHQALSRRGPGNSLYNLREFRPGDDSRAIHWMTTARTSKLMLKETEAEDQRWVTLAISTVAPVEEDDAFERALSIAASLLDLLLKDGYHVRLLLEDQQEILASGPEQFLHLLHPLALCERRPVTSGASIRQAIAQALGESHGGLTLLLLPWVDPAKRDEFPAVDHVISPQSYRDLFDAVRSRLPA
ncbi:MAG: DUF58 domain-containing protein [Nitrospira defluvii]|nr:DUF58 domain-containing protein [Nitrospira defluvii]